MHFCFSGFRTSLSHLISERAIFGRFSSSCLLKSVFGHVAGIEVHLLSQVLVLKINNCVFTFASAL